MLLLEYQGEARLEPALVGALGAVAGAVIALAGSFLAERLRERAERRRWQLDQRLQLYSQMVELTQAARNLAYGVVLGKKGFETSIYTELGSVRTRIDLLASQAAIIAMDRNRDLTHNDEHAADLAYARRAEPAKQYRSGREFLLSDFSQWLDARDAMQNAFRADLGLQSVRLGGRDEFLNHEDDAFEDGR